MFLFGPLQVSSKYGRVFGLDQLPFCCSRGFQGFNSMEVSVGYAHPSAFCMHRWFLCVVCHTATLTRTNKGAPVWVFAGVTGVGASLPAKLWLAYALILL